MEALDAEIKKPYRMAHDIGLLPGSKAKAENTSQKGESLPLSR